MVFRRSPLFAVASVVAISFNVTAAAPKKHTAAGAGEIPTSYAEKVGDIDDCASFYRRAAELPNAVPLLVRGSQADASALSKDEFETSAQFTERQSDYWRKHVGDPTRLVIRVPIDSYKVSYDADRRVATIKHLIDWWPDYQTLEFATRDLGKREYTGSNAFGATALVRAYREAQYRLRFPKGALRADLGGEASPQWEMSLTVEQAKAFKSKPILLLLAEFEPPYLERSSGFVEATIDSPSSLSLEKYSFDVQLNTVSMSS